MTIWVIIQRETKKKTHITNKKNLLKLISTSLKKRSKKPKLLLCHLIPHRAVVLPSLYFYPPNASHQVPTHLSPFGSWSIIGFGSTLHKIFLLFCFETPGLIHSSNDLLLILINKRMYITTRCSKFFIFKTFKNSDLEITRRGQSAS